MRWGATVAIALLTSAPCLAATSTALPKQVYLPAKTASPTHQATNTSPVKDPWEFEKVFVGPGVAFFIGLVNLAWNYRNSRRTTEVDKAIRRATRKVASLNQYRLDVLGILKDLRVITNELTAIPRAANYNGAFKPIQDRFVATGRRLRSTLEMISHDPEVDGADWNSCFSAHYDHFLDCCNTLLSPATTEPDHELARARLQAIGTELQTDVLGRFSFHPCMQSLSLRGLGGRQRSPLPPMLDAPRFRPQPLEEIRNIDAERMGQLQQSAS